MSVESLMRVLETRRNLGRIPLGTPKRDTLVEIGKKERQRLNQEDAEFLEAFEHLSSNDQTIVTYLLRKMDLLFSRLDES